MVNRKFKIYYCFDLCLNSTGFLEKDKGNLFLSMYVAYSANELAVIYGFSLLKSTKAEFTASSDNSPRYFFLISENTDY